MPTARAPALPGWSRSATPTSPGGRPLGRQLQRVGVLRDALGPTAYFDNASNSGEQITRCHRSTSAEIFIGGGVNSLNLACSGAETSSIVTSCVEDFLSSPTWWKNYCHDDSSVTANFTPANVAAVRARIATAYRNIRTAMRNAGYADTAWTLLVQNYESPIPTGSAFRYSESGYTRQSTGGCGFWNADADWANNTALPTIDHAVVGAAADSGLVNVRTLDLASAFTGHQLCENTDDLVEKHYTSWRAPGAADGREWVDQIRTVSTAGSDYYIQESLHPNYWGQLAVRNCVRQAWNAGTPRSGTCTSSGTGLVNGEPRMTLH